MKKEQNTLQAELKNEFPVNVRRYVKWAIVAFVGFVITSIVVSIAVVIIIAKYLVSPAINSLPDYADQGSKWLQNQQSELEKRLTNDEEKIKLLEDKVQELQNIKPN